MPFWCLVLWSAAWACEHRVLGDLFHAWPEGQLAEPAQCGLGGHVLGILNVHDVKDVRLRVGWYTSSVISLVSPRLVHPSHVEDAINHV